MHGSVLSGERWASAYTADRERAPPCVLTLLLKLLPTAQTIHWMGKRGQTWVPVPIVLAVIQATALTAREKRLLFLSLSPKKEKRLWRTPNASQRKSSSVRRVVRV